MNPRACSVCGRRLKASTGIGPKCARKLGLPPPPAPSRSRASPPPEPATGQTTIPIQPTLPKEN